MTNRLIVERFQTKDPLIVTGEYKFAGRTVFYSK